MAELACDTPGSWGSWTEVSFHLQLPIHVALLDLIYSILRHESTSFNVLSGS
jgi:hypothetical protein